MELVIKLGNFWEISGQKAGSPETGGSWQWAASLEKESGVGRIKDCQVKTKQVSPSAGPFGRKHGLPLNRLCFPPSPHTGQPAGSEGSTDNPRCKLWWINDSNISSGSGNCAPMMIWRASEISDGFYLWCQLWTIGDGCPEHCLEKCFEGHIWEECCDWLFMSAKSLDMMREVYLLPFSWK